MLCRIYRKSDQIRNFTSQWACPWWESVTDSTGAQLRRGKYMLWDPTKRFEIRSFRPVSLLSDVNAVPRLVYTCDGLGNGSRCVRRTRTTSSCLFPKLESPYGSGYLSGVADAWRDLEMSESGNSRRATIPEGKTANENENQHSDDALGSRAHEARRAPRRPSHRADVSRQASADTATVTFRAKIQGSRFKRPAVFVTRRVVA
ncbi:hypothetical protein BD311DRAFT_257427 [Dichomitus squalens]|uniref:Uncharacterized protein n=1 Tax=Dichomitus squalens TaxID=114155 RepID=A0A4Q9M3E1_9APHY|nr:hypothetical protein BD311DRAFT_257427 [Dichomitus squalens]